MSFRPGRGLILSAPASGAGKSLLTMGLLRHLRRIAVPAAAAKVGPDYIDPAFHAAAVGGIGWNLDPWAMRAETLADILEEIDRPDVTVLCEGVMGLFDGSGPDGEEGSTASLAAATGWPVILIVDARGMTGSVAALARGFAGYRPDVDVAGIILNRVGSARHGELIRAALARALPEMPLLGAIPRDDRLALAERHLGLVQAGEQAGLDVFLDRLADIVADGIDIPALLTLARPRIGPPSAAPGIADNAPLPPPGQRVAVARDIAFAFAYPHLLRAWRAAGAEIGFFSPLVDEAPAGDCDAVYLPGGYPELHGGTLAAARRFGAGMRAAAARGAAIYGECGGYMALGRALTDLEGRTWPMLDLLPVETGFAPRRLSLGYRTVTAPCGPSWLGRGPFRAHEFHYAHAVADDGPGLFTDAPSAGGGSAGQASGPRSYGQVSGNVAGSFIHLIDSRPHHPRSAP